MQFAILFSAHPIQAHPSPAVQFLQVSSTPPAVVTTPAVQFLQVSNTPPAVVTTLCASCDSPPPTAEDLNPALEHDWVDLYPAHRHEYLNQQSTLLLKQFAEIAVLPFSAVTGFYQLRITDSDLTWLVGAYFFYCQYLFLSRHNMTVP
jgi:hypothetical protein